MGVFSRISDIFNSNINSMLDKAEDPQKMVRLIIQEMEETLVEVRSAAARAIADRNELTRKADAAAAEAHEWERKAEVAINKNRDDLAELALIEKAKCKDQADAIQSELNVLASTLTILNDDIAKLEAKLKDAKKRQASLTVRGETSKVRLGVRRQLSRHNIDNVLERFEQHERKLDEYDGKIEAYDMGSRSLAEEIEELEGNDRVRDELDRLKKRIRSTESGKNESSVKPSEGSSA